MATVARLGAMAGAAFVPARQSLLRIDGRQITTLAAFARLSSSVTMMPGQRVLDFAFRFFHPRMAVMTDLSIHRKSLPTKPKNKVRFVTAASLFDGHDASINIMRRILQSTGAEVIHLGHNRSVEIVNAALQEDVQGIAITSYQGGHVEFFKYADRPLKAGGSEIKVFGGGGGSSCRPRSRNCTNTA